MSRRLVAVLFMDLVGWTSMGDQLDPEPLQQFLEQYYEICVAAVDRNGGIVEKFIGDAIMAVFGAERSQENDALSALIAAVQTRAEVSRLAVVANSPVAPTVHCGLAAGEALVTRSAHAGVRIVGDVVNLAARLQSAASAGEILMNEVMARLVRSNAALVPVSPIQLKGKREPVPAWRAVDVSELAASGRMVSPLVDRDEERGRLLAAYQAVTRTGRAQTVMIAGAAGIGKSRLVEEVVRQVSEGDGPPPLTASVTSVSVGEVGTFTPLAQLLAAFMADPDVASSVAGAKGGRLLRVLSYLQAPSDAVGKDPAPGTEEVSWAVRELLTQTSRPRVVIWEDLDSAGPALLGIVADLIESLRDAAVLMICVARRPPLPLSQPTTAGKPPWSLLEVPALSGPDTADLVGRLAWAAGIEQGEVMAQSADALSQVIEDCAGNPLYAELMVETLVLGYSAGEVPPTITALIGAMIDRLPSAVVAVLEAAAVAGTAISLDRLALLGVTPAPGVVDDLVQLQLFQADRVLGTYRFAQRLVQEVVYRRVDKRQRIRLHRVLAEQGVSPGFHLEAVVHLLGDVGSDDPELPRLAARAAEALLSEGTAALRRRNLPAAVELLARACVITPDEATTKGADGRRAVAIIRLSDAHLLAGDLAAAQALLAQPIARAPQSRTGRACRLQQAILTVRTGERADDQAAALALELRLDRADHMSWCRLHQLRMLQQIGDGRFRAAEQSARRALQRAETMSDGYEQDRLLAALCEVGQWSPTPIPEKLAFCADLAVRFAEDRALLVPVLVARARFTALLGNVTEATAVLAEAREIVTDLRLAMAEILVDQGHGVVASLAGAHEDAERYFRSAAQALKQSGHQQTALAVRALAVRERLLWRQDDEAAREARTLADLADQMDQRGRVRTLGVAALATATGSSPDELARVATRMLDRTDDACLRGDVLTDLAAAYARGGDQAKAREMARAAAASYEAVGASLPLRGSQQWL